MTKQQQEDTRHRDTENTEKRQNRKNKEDTGGRREERRSKGVHRLHRSRDYIDSRSRRG
jgi:hypothetical protein